MDEVMFRNLIKMLNSPDKQDRILCGAMLVSVVNDMTTDQFALLNVLLYRESSFDEDSALHTFRKLIKEKRDGLGEI